MRRDLTRRILTNPYILPLFLVFENHADFFSLDLPLRQPLCGPVHISDDPLRRRTRLRACI